MSSPAAVAEVPGTSLVHVTDAIPGIRRRRIRGGFRYLHPDGSPIEDEGELARIRKLAIPPAWDDVWICPHPYGYLQATGRDAKGRKQYRYHPEWRKVRDENKYERTIAFGEALPLIRKRVEEDLAKPGLPREKVIAAVVRLLETTLIRVGNSEYARDNNSFGLTTMRDRHVAINGSEMRFEFVGKSSKRHKVALRDRRLARIVKQCRELPGHELFQYIDEEGNRQSVDSSDVNAYLREIAGREFTSKDFRTWAGTVLATLALEEFENFASPTEAKRNLVQAVESVSKYLGNTPSVCRNCYIHPDVVDYYLDGSLADAFRRKAEQAMMRPDSGLEPQEAAVLALLRQRLRERAKHQEQKQKGVRRMRNRSPTRSGK